MADRLIMKLSIEAVTRETPDVISIVFKHPRRPGLPPWSAGAHIDVHIPQLGVRQYSLCGDPGDSGRYRIAVKREQNGRGGSQWLHDNAAPGLSLPVSAPRNHFTLEPANGPHLLIAGGIGITPMLAMARELATEGNGEFHLHFCARSRETAPLLSELEALCGERLSTWFSNEGNRLDVAASLAENRDAQIYACGPASLLSALEDATRSAGLPLDHLHVEHFEARPDDGIAPEPFSVQLASSGKTLEVPADRSLLSILSEHGIKLDSSCEIGVCGSCECGYSEGQVLHRDVVLSPDMKKTRLMPCVSRGTGTIILDL